MITIDFVYKLLAEAYTAYPVHAHKCKSPQTFAVLQHLADLNTSNLGKTLHDGKEGYFKSKAWDATNNNANNVVGEFPVVGVQNQTLRVSNLGEKNHKVSYDIVLGVYDKLDDPCIGEDCHPCKQRNFHQIEFDTEVMLLRILSYIEHIQKASINGGPDMYYSKKYLDYLKTVEGQTVVIKMPRVNFIANFDRGFGTRAQTGIDKLIGTEITLSVEATYCFDEPFNFTAVVPIKSISDCGC